MPDAPTGPPTARPRGSRRACDAALRLGSVKAQADRGFARADCGRDTAS
ncbi:hypothetical protein [Alienimonas californiensis]|uniref:Uncharacterized protein n=1 Tax=Alienimonas californiensis TaxID=2527989 RepID=A0A517PCS3_9PLAN|nr:hypothetical protein [Alienimonas californiensis]QDT17178.1 hypothetical protein CA12_32900 [Alienimonas californiensis]